MRDKNTHIVEEEAREQDRAKRRHVKRNPKMKMTGKGMKRFAVPAGRQANPKKPSTNG
ncbi:MAG: hypothetical protein NTX72_05000 [Candidatus Uhrbacteria bacterium]|nr:hypothetical protein [Candidatus Uhrbacteria bacterium]